MEYLFNQTNTDNITCKNLTVEDAEGYLFSEFQRVFILIVVPAITVLGLSTNTAFLFVIYKVKTMRTATNFYLANLAVADGVLLIVTTLNYVLTYTKSPIDNGYPFKSSGCAVSMLVIYVFSFASIAFLTLVALERYQAVCMPITYRQRNVGSNPLSTNIKLTVLTWMILIIIVASPVSFVHEDRSCVIWPQQEPFTNFSPVLKLCKWPNWTWLFLDLFDVCEFSIALFINITVYIRIVQELNKRQGPKGKSTAARSHVARMLCINAVVFFICLCPIQLSNIKEVYQIVNQKDFAYPVYGPTIDYIILWLGRVAFLCNSTVNPIIYNISNPEYRKAFKSAFGITATTFKRGRFESNTLTTDPRETEIVELNSKESKGSCL